MTPLEFRVLDLIPLGLCVLDPTLKVRWWNHQLERWTGLSAAEVVGQSAYQIFPHLEKPIYRMRLETTLQCGLPTVFSSLLHGSLFPCKNQAGEECCHETTVTPIPHEDGQNLALVSIHDVTQLTRLVRDYKHLRNQALAVARAKSDFLANLSHEIRTPMNGILGLSELMAGSELSTDQRDWLEGIQTSGETLLALINDVLDLSKVESGKMSLEMVEIDLEEMVDGVLDLLGPTARSKGILLFCDVAPGVPDRILGDPIRLKQILINLAGNAIKFTSQGHVAIRVLPLPESLSSAGPDTGSIRIEVEDTGIGIPLQAQARLTEPFYQADKSTARHFGGTGLGLAICSNLIQLMGGRLRIESSPGEGSTFSFDLEVRLGPTRSRPLEGLRILLQGPTGPVRDSLSHRLQRLGATCYLEAQACPQPDALFFSPQSPPMPGFGSRQIAWLVGPPSPQDHPESSAEAIVRLPFKRERLIAATLAKNPEPSQRAVPREPLKTHARILVAEDNSVNRKVIDARLRNLGYTPILVCNGREAISALQQQDYDLVLMDCHMPVLDGYDATREWRRQEKARTPIVALTAQALASDRSRCLECGMDDYLSKPFKTEELEQILSRWLVQPRQALSCNTVEKS